MPPLTLACAWHSSAAWNGKPPEKEATTKWCWSQTIRILRSWHGPTNFKLPLCRSASAPKPAGCGFACMLAPSRTSQARVFKGSVSCCVPSQEMQQELQHRDVVWRRAYTTQLAANATQGAEHAAMQGTKGT